MKLILSPELSTCGFTVRSIDRDADAVTTISKAGKKRLRWAKELEHIQVIPSRYCDQLKPIAISDFELRVQQIRGDISDELTIIENQTKEETELELIIDRLLISKCSATLAVVQLKQAVDTMNSQRKIMDTEIRSMRIDTIQWKGRRSSLKRSHSYDDAKLCKRTDCESLKSFWSGATAVLNKAWATSA
jgi:hypothetical protein